jgi:hypothetical protein
MIGVVKLSPKTDLAVVASVALQAKQAAESDRDCQFAAAPGSRLSA